MAAKTIVTFHPDVACAVCGRRLLRGERPDVFLGGGQRRTVCELCAPRATHEGWRREVDEQVASPRPQRSQRGRSLLGRLRQLREPAAAGERSAAGTEIPELDRQPPTGENGDTGAEWTGIASEWTAIDDEWAGMTEEHILAADRPTGAAEVHVAELEQAPGGTSPGEASSGQSDISGRIQSDAGADADVLRALALFNAGEPPRRVAGVARALGAASVRAAPVAGAKGLVSIVVAWELCWYRYEIDLGDEASGIRIAAEGMELEELTAEDRVANATADERGELSLLAS